MAESALGIDGGTTSDMDVIRESFAAPERFGAVFERHFGRIFRYLSLRTGPSAAEDLTAQTFAVAFERRASVEGKGGSALPWLYGIASNLLRNEQRREQHWLSAAVGVSAHEPWSSIGDPVLESEARYLLEAVDGLDESHREALLLFVWADLSYFEIAEALSIPVGTVASRISRARNALRSILDSGSREAGRKAGK
jgi:RNA polymerase sigma-70 factor (ECF subfamily)